MTKYRDEDGFPLVWRTREGKRLSIEEMTTEHIKNAISVMEKIIATYPGEMIYGGDSDAAGDAVEAENNANDMLLEERKMILGCLKRELEKR